jgi:hypothetical protein
MNIARLVESRLVRSCAVLTGFAVILAGCHTTRSRAIREALEESTGTTISSAFEPLVYARSEASYSRSGRDYLYLGPVRTNRRGTLDYFLWVGIATTLDRGYLAPEADIPVAIYVPIQDELIELPLHPWRERVAGIETFEVYDTPVEPRATLAARVTLDQLTLFARESPRLIRVADAEGKTRTFARWDDRQTWSAFAE